MNTILAPMAFVFIAVAISIIAHKKFLLKNPDYFLLISLVAGALSSLIFQIVGFFVLGYLDPFVVVAFVLGLLAGTAISILIGFVFRSINKKASS